MITIDYTGKGGHVCIPQAPGADWAQASCGQVTDFFKLIHFESFIFKNSEYAKASCLFNEIKLHRTSVLLLVNSLLSMFTQDCVSVRKRLIISPKTTSLTKDLSVQARPAQKEELKIQAKNTCQVQSVKILEKLCHIVAF